MHTFNAQDIRKRARSGTSITFLKSKAIADAIAKKVEAGLKAQGVGGSEVLVREDPGYPGAWMVWVLHFGFHTPRGSDMAGAYHAINTGEGRAIDKILDEAYTPADLLTSWPASSRRR